MTAAEALVDGFGGAAADPGFPLLAAACAAAGVVRGFSGFGTALVFMPLAVTVAGAPTALAALLIFDAFGAPALLPGALRLCRGREVARLFAGVVLGVPAGVAALAALDALTLRWGICLLALASAAALASGWRWRGAAPDWMSYPVGFASGLFGGAAGLSGAPVVLFHLGRARAAAHLRADVIVLFFFASFVSWAWLFGRGLAGWDAAALGLLLGPVFWLGVQAGRRLFPLASEGLFRRAAYALIFASAIVGLPLWDGPAGG